MFHARAWKVLFCVQYVHWGLEAVLLTEEKLSFGF